MLSWHVQNFVATICYHLNQDEYIKSTEQMFCWKIVNEISGTPDHYVLFTRWGDNWQQHLACKQTMWHVNKQPGDSHHTVSHQGVSSHITFLSACLVYSTVQIA